MKHRPHPPTFSPMIGDYDAILARLTRRAETAEVNVDGDLIRPLQSLNVAAAHDIGVGLLRSWATIGDILSFYEQRLRDEGYVNDGRDPLSQRLIADMVGYAPGFAQPSRVYLSYSLAGGASAPKTADIPAGPETQALSIPQTGAAPETFENARSLTARAGWDDLPIIAATTAQPHTISNGALEARVVGAAPSLHVGGQVALLIEGQSVLRKISKVERNAKDGWTRIWWTTPLRLADTRPYLLQAVYGFKQRAALFGVRAGDWAKTSTTVKAQFGQHQGGVLTQKATPRAAAHLTGHGLPYADVRALATSGDTVFAATAKGVYREANRIWTRSATLPPTFSAYSLHAARNGDLYAGGVRGALLISADGGQSWRSVKNEMKVTPPSHWLLKILLWLLTHILKLKPTKPKQTKPSKTPEVKINGAIKAIATYGGETGEDKDRFVLIGTDQGVFKRREGDLYWTPFGANLPGYDDATGLAQTPVNDLCVIPSKHGGEASVMAATDHGLYVSGVDQADWLRHDLGDHKDQPVVHCVAALETAAYAGAENGLYVAHTRGDWALTDFKGLQNKPVLSLIADDTAGPHGRPLVVAGAPCADDDPDDPDNVGGAFALFPKGWVHLAKRRRPVFVAPNAYSDDLTEPKTGEKKVSAPLRALFAAKGYVLPDEARLAGHPGGDRWRIVTGEGETEETLFHIGARGASLHVSQVLDRSDIAVSALAFGPQGEIITAAKPGAFYDQTWPGYEIRTPTLSLDRAVKGLTPGSTIALESGGVHGLYPVHRVDNQPVDQFNKTGVVTTATIGVDARLGFYNLRDTAVYFQSTLLAPFAPQVPLSPALSGARIAVAADASDVEAGRLGALTGASATATLAALGGIGAATRPAARLFPGLDVTAAAVTDQGLAIGAADGRVYLNSEQNGGVDDWVCIHSFKAPVTALTGWRGVIFAAAADGDVISHIDDETTPASDGLDGVAITQFLTGPGDLQYAVAGPIVYRLHKNRRAWNYPIHSDGAGDIRQAAFSPNGRLFAACEGGLRQLTKGADEVEFPSAPFDAYALAFRSDGALFLGVPGDVLAYGRDGWRRLNCPAGGVAVSALAFDGAGTLWAGGRGMSPMAYRNGGWRAPTAACAANDVSAFTPVKGRLLVAYGARTWLGDARGQTKPLTETILAAGPASLADGAADGVISPALSTLMLNHGHKLDHGASLGPGPQPDQWILRTGDKAFRLLRRAERGDVAIFQAALLSPTTSADGVRVSDAEGYAVIAAKTDLSLGPALSGAPKIAEIVTVAKAAQAGSTAELTLSAPLNHIYDNAGAVLSLNVAPAVEGQTITNEPLTPLDPDLRRYAVGRGPVLAGADGEGSSIKAAVGAVGAARFSLAGPTAPAPVTAAWREVGDLQAFGPAARVYATAPTGDGAVLKFGDGVHGARPPKGAEVSASWRIRTGPSGDAPAGAVRIFRNRPAGVKGVSNPLAATGGDAPPGPAQMRYDVIRSLAMTDRIVSLGDYEAAARAFPCVQAALALHWPETAPTEIVVAALAKPDETVDITALSATLNARRAHRARLTVQAARISTFTVRIALTMKSGGAFAAAADKAKAAIDAYFTGVGAGIGGVVEQDLLTSLAAAADTNVAHARVALLYRTVHAKAHYPRLTAAKPTWRETTQDWTQGEALRPAPKDGVEIVQEGSADG